MAWIWRLNDTTNYPSAATMNVAANDGDTCITNPDATFGNLILNEKCQLTKGIDITFAVQGMSIRMNSANDVSWNPTAGSTLIIRNLNFDLGDLQTGMFSNASKTIMVNCTARCRYLQTLPATTSEFYNCRFYDNESSSLSPLVISGSVKIINCVIVASRIGVRMNDAGGSLDIYNTDIVAPTPIAMLAGTLSQNYNRLTVAETGGGGGAGANNVVGTPVENGYLCTTTGQNDDYRVAVSDEVLGTTNANGTDLTTVSYLDNDIDGRSRATYGYQIGISAGFDVIQNAVWTAASNVLDGVDRGDGVLGTRTDAPEAKVEKDWDYGGDGTSLIGTFDEAARNTDPGIANVALATAYKILGVDLVGTRPDIAVTYPTLSITGLIATVADVDAAAEITLILTQAGEDKWITGGTRVGPGTIDFTSVGLANGNYEGRAISVGSPGLVSDVDTFTLSTSVSTDYPDENWDRWIYASLSNHFDLRRGSLPMFVEGQHRRTDDLSEFFELRTDGPWCTEISKDYWRLYVEVNLLVQSAKDNENYHRHRQLTGQMANMCVDCIPIYKYGNSAQDDQSLLGYMQRDDDYRGKKRIQTNHFGQIEPKLQLEQSTVEVHYVMHLNV